MSQPYDLLSLAAAQSALAASLPADVTALPLAISAASRAVRRWLGRDVVRADYDELYDGRGWPKLVLREYPVNSVAGIWTTPTAVLTIKNADTATNQAATAALATTGDVDSGLVVTGIALSRTASGVVATDGSPVLFSANPTLQSIADAIVALGHGWAATVTTGYAPWPSASLRYVQGAQAALGGGAGAQFLLHATPLSGWSIDERAGIVDVNALGAGFDPAFAIQSAAVGGGNTPAAFAPGFRNIRVRYNAGYATIPEDIQQATLMTVKAMLYDLQTVHVYESETAKDWSATLAGAERSGLPKAAQKLLLAAGRKSYRRR